MTQMPRMTARDPVTLHILSLGELHENQTWTSTVNQRSITATQMAPWHGPNDSKHQGSQLQRHQSWDQWMPIVHALPCFPARGGSQHERIEIVLEALQSHHWLDECGQRIAKILTDVSDLQHVSPTTHYTACKFVLVDTCPQQNLYVLHESSTRIHWQALILLMEKTLHQLTRSIAHDLLRCMQIYLKRYNAYQQVQDFFHQKYVKQNSSVWLPKKKDSSWDHLKFPPVFFETAPSHPILAAAGSLDTNPGPGRHIAWAAKACKVFPVPKKAGICPLSRVPHPYETWIWRHIPPTKPTKNQPVGGDLQHASNLAIPAWCCLWIWSFAD